MNYLKYFKNLFWGRMSSVSPINTPPPESDDFCQGFLTFSSIDNFQIVLAELGNKGNIIEEIEELKQILEELENKDLNEILKNQGYCESIKRLFEEYATNKKYSSYEFKACDAIQKVREIHEKWPGGKREQAYIDFGKKYSEYKGDKEIFKLLAKSLTFSSLKSTLVHLLDKSKTPEVELGLFLPAIEAAAKELGSFSN